VLVLLDGESADGADYPVVGQRLGPRRIEHETRRGPFVLNRHPFGEAI
jgi:hypothetical protein